MAQDIMLDEKTAKQVERIARTLEKTGYGENYRAGISEKLAAGIKEFTLPAEKPFQFGNDRLDVVVVVGMAKNDPSNVVLKGIDAYLTKAIKIPPVVIQDQSGHVLVDVRNLEDRLANPPVKEKLPPALQEEFKSFQKKYKDEISNDMQLLMKAFPDVFNSLHVKYNPKLPFEVAPELQEQQAKMAASLNVQNMFSSYFNLTPLEIYGMLKNELPVNKDLFKTNKTQPSALDGQPQNQQNERYNAWFKINFNERGEDGSYKIDFIKTRKGSKMWDALSKYNFTELDNEVGRMTIIHHLKKASLIEVTNGNKAGERKVLIGADPGFEMRLKLYKLDGTPVLNHNAYLGNPLEKQISEVVSLPVVDGRTGKSAKQGQAAQMPGVRAVVFDGATQTFSGDPLAREVEKAYRKNFGPRNVAGPSSTSKKGL